MFIWGFLLSFFELMNETERFMLNEGVSRTAAKPFISSFYSSLAKQTERSAETYADMAGNVRLASFYLIPTTLHCN